MERLQLDPHILSVWASPTELRFGLDKTLATLSDPPPRIERLIDALRRGMPASHLPHMAKAFGVSTRERDELLSALEPVLSPSTSAHSVTSQTVNVALDCPEDARRQLSSVAALLDAAGFVTSCNTFASAHTDADTDSAQVAVLLTHFVTPVARARFWATRGTPHLQVVFSEQQVRIGPFAGVHGNACLLCLQLHLTDAEPSWPAMASQCLGRKAATLEPGFLAVTTGVIISTLTDWRHSGRALVGEQIVIERDTHSGFTLRSEALTPHERCDCQQLLS